MRSLDDIKRRQLEEARRITPRPFWARLTAALHHWERRAKSIAAFGTAIGALITLTSRAWHYMKDREVAPAELPATGQPTIATDHVEKPKAP